MLVITEGLIFFFFVSGLKNKLIKSVNLFLFKFYRCRCGMSFIVLPFYHYNGKIIAERVNKITFEKYESSYRKDILSP